MEIFDELYARYPQLKGCEAEIAKAFETLLIQELHLPVYHALCAALEDSLT